MDSVFEHIDIDSNHYDVIYPGLSSTESSKYYQINEFNELNFNNKSDLLLLNYNIRSLCANFDLFHGFSQLLNIKFDIISFTESWLKENNKQLYAINGYNDFHSLRSDGRRGGGISVFISNKYDCKIIKNSSLSLEYIETLFIEVTRANKKILIASIYKPNRSNDNLFIEKLSHLLSINSNNNYHEIIVTGDFNFDLLKYQENNITLNFINSLNSQSFIPVISKPTRVTDTTATLIDNIFISNPINFTSGIIVADISDHFPIFIGIKNVFSNNNTDQDIRIEYRDINENTLHNFYQYLSSYDFSNVINYDDCSTAISELTEIIDDAYRTCCPIKIKTISYKDYSKPWISKKILTLIRKRQHFYLLFRKNIVSKKTYTDFRNFHM